MEALAAQGQVLAVPAGQGHLLVPVAVPVMKDLVKGIHLAGAAVEIPLLWVPMTVGAGVICLTVTSVLTRPQLVPVVRGSARNAGVTGYGCVTTVNTSG